MLQDSLAVRLRQCNVSVECCWTYVTRSGQPTGPLVSDQCPSYLLSAVDQSKRKCARRECRVGVRATRPSSFSLQLDTSAFLPLLLANAYLLSCDKRRRFRPLNGNGLITVTRFKQLQARQPATTVNWTPAASSSEQTTGQANRRQLVVCQYPRRDAA